MTAPALPRSDAAPRRPGIKRPLAIRLAETEFERCAEVFTQLDADQWAAPTVNTGWTVRDTAGHMLGMVEMISSLPQMIRQLSTSARLAKRAGAPVSIDHLTALQVERNAGLTTAELVERWRRLAPRAVGGRRRIPGVVRSRTMSEAQLVGGRLERWTFGFMADVILTRDPWMHRLDICAATGLDPRLTAEHDGRIVDDVVREWADRHGRPYTLELTGPAGGTWGGDGEHITADAVDFCRILSGRGDATGLLATAVPF